MPKPRIAIIGTGFIGGSIGLALKKTQVDAEIVGHDKDHAIATRAQKRGAVDSAKWNLHDACDGAAMIILAMPLAGIKQTLDALKQHLPPGVIVTDTASTKVPVLQWANELPDQVFFVGGNLILKPTRARAQGIDAADAEALQGATYCLVAPPRPIGNALDSMSNFAAMLGAQPYFINADEHDGIITGVQHLPALLAAAFASSIIQSNSWRESGKLAGADFRDATDLAPDEGKAASDRFLAHRDDLIRWTDALIQRLQDVRGMIERGDAASIEKMVDDIAHARARWLSGNLEQTAPAVDWKDVQFSPQRMFLGSLGDRFRRSH